MKKRSSLDEKRILQSAMERINKMLKKGKYSITGVNVPHFQEVWERIEKEHPELKRYPKEKRERIKSDVERIYGLTLFQNLYREGLKEAKEKKVEAYWRDPYSYLNRIKPRIDHILCENGVRVEYATSISEIPREREHLRGYAGELVAELLTRATYGRKNVYGESGDIYKQPKAYTKGESGRYLKPEQSIVYEVPGEKGNTQYFFVEVKTAKKSKKAIENLVEKYMNKTIDTARSVNGKETPKKTTGGLLILLGNETIDDQTKKRAYEKGVMVIDKKTFSDLMNYENKQPGERILKGYGEEVERELQTNEELRRKFAEMMFEKPKDPLKFLDKESKTVYSFIENEKNRIVSRKERKKQYPSSRMEEISTAEEKKINGWLVPENKRKRRKRR